MLKYISIPRLGSPFITLTRTTDSPYHTINPLTSHNNTPGKLQIHTPNYTILTNSYPILHFHTPHQKNGV